MSKVVEIHPSLLSADFANLGRDVLVAQECGAEGIHCDIMDGHFVPNITFGPPVVKAIRPLTKLPLCCHLMIENPEKYVEAFVNAGADEITVHAEAAVHLHRLLQQIRATGVRVGAALNPATPLCMVEHIMTDLDVLLLMTVNPGFGGQSFIENVLPKISQARRMADEANPNIDIAVDGGIDVKTIGRVVRAGANVFVAGTAFYHNELPPAQAFAALKVAAQSDNMV